LVAPAPAPTLSPYTTLFRSRACTSACGRGACACSARRAARGVAKVALWPQCRGLGLSLRRLGQREDRVGGRRIAHEQADVARGIDRKSTRLNSSHRTISYAV